jgi:hypothetical protein
MSLSAKHCRKLDTIETALRGSDPGLTALFAVFTRLNAGEEMPRIEEVRRRAGALPGWALRRVTFAGGWLTRRPGRWVRAAIFLPLALGLLAASFALSPRYLGSNRCASMLAATKPVRPARSRAQLHSCSRIMVSPMFFGK